MIATPRPVHAALAALLPIFALAALAGPGCGDMSPGSYRPRSTGATVIEPGPRLEITSPSAAAFLAPGPVLVEGRARPADEPGAAHVASVRLAGQDVPLDADGRFRRTIVLAPGLGVIDAAATDARGHKTTTSIGVLAGEWNPVDQKIPAAATGRLNDAALVGIAGLAEGLLASYDLGPLLQAPVYDGGWSFLHATVHMRRPVFQSVQVTLDARPDGIYFTAEIARPIVEAEAVGTAAGFRFGPETVVLTGDSIFGSGRIVPFARPDRKIGVRVEDVVVDIRSLTFTITSTWVQMIEPLLRSIVASQVERFALAFVDDFRPALETILDDWLTPTTPFDVLGKPFTLDVRAESIALDDDGLSVALEFDAPVAPADRTARGAAAPGSFKTAGATPAIRTARGIAACLDDDALNRMLHAAWAAGILERDIDAAAVGPALAALAKLAGGTGSSAVPSLDAGFLKMFLPEIGAEFPNASPLSLRVRADLPPVLEVSGAPDVAVVHLGELHVEFLVDRGAGAELLLELVVHARASLEPELGPAGVGVQSNRLSEVRADIVRQPIVRFDERKVESLVGMALPPLLPRILGGIRLLPLPAMPGATIRDATAEPYGPAREHIAVSVDITR